MSAAVVRDLVYRQIGGLDLKLDLYLPRSGPEPYPLVMWVRGGGWQKRDKSACASLAAWLTDYGFAVAGIEYRVSDEACFPAQVEDCKEAVRWLRVHAGTYGLDGCSIGAWGNSAGGHLVALLGTTAGVKAFEGNTAYPEVSAGVQAVCDFFGPTDLASLSAELSDMVTALLGASPVDRPDLAAAASPLSYVSSASAPHLIVHGDADRAVPIEHSMRLLQALHAHGVAAKLHVLENHGHYQGGVFYGNAGVRSEVVRFFEATLRRV